jgi:HEAT repeat protein
LPADCALELRAVARHLLDGMPHTGEGSLNIVLDALTIRQDPTVSSFLIDALENRYTMRKEDYVSMLDDLGKSEQAPASLLAVLADGAEHPDRDDLAIAIRALHSLRYEQAVRPMLTHVGHPDRAVRGTAIEFLYEFDNGSEAGPVFVERLTHEREPHILEMLVDGLTRWGRLPDKRFVEQLRENLNQSETTREAAQRALQSHLDSGSDGSDSPPVS